MSKNIVKGGMVPGDYSNAPQVVTTNERLVQELEDAGLDPDLIAEAEAQMLEVMDELGCS